jgi:hypothetical protein
MQAIALWLGLAALTFQALAPLCLAGLMSPGKDSGSFPIVLCTAHGLAGIHAGTSGNPSPDRPSPQDQSACPLCSALAGLSHFTAPAAVLLAAPFAWIGAGRKPIASEIKSARPVANYISRAPPRAKVPMPA